MLTYATGGWMMGWASAPYDPHWSERYPKRAAWMSLAGPGGQLLARDPCRDSDPRGDVDAVSSTIPIRPVSCTWWSRWAGRLVAGRVHLPQPDVLAQPAAGHLQPDSGAAAGWLWRPRSAGLRRSRAAHPDTSDARSAASPSSACWWHGRSSAPCSSRSSPSRCALSIPARATAI